MTHLHTMKVVMIRFFFLVSTFFERNAWDAELPFGTDTRKKKQQTTTKKKTKKRLHFLRLAFLKRLLPNLHQGIFFPIVLKVTSIKLSV